MSRFFQVLAALLPLALFVGGNLVVKDLFERGEGKDGIILMLLSLVALAVCEGLLFKLWLLPAWSRSLSERVYSGSYTPDQDALVVLIDRIRQEKDRLLLEDLARLVRQDATRARGWMEWAALLEDEFHDREEALKVLLDGAGHMRRKEDKAMFLYRAAHLCETRMGKVERARELYAEAAKTFPRTAFGQQAAARQKTL